MTSNNLAFIHPLADVQAKEIGVGTNIWQFNVVLAGARIGANCNVSAHCFIENDVVVGDNVTVKSGVYLWDGITLESNVFIGPGAIFTNDLFPRSKVYPESFLRTTVCRGASIGAGAVITPGITIGHDAMVAAGAVVTRDVAPFSLVVGSPARHVRFLNQE
ncbi:dTDP-6-deoxy-3,4-keto-hexulose isomerase [Variovorax sp. RO1]|uniref:acyltransferase n=1 Tax=Variovorax sp. RO1 TaxID=2066034 RepID=UPI000C716FEA|nr:acyltransferase [Variovorax sp. RO1]PLC05781.1 dTDP-6-deoxy-3,4-keto-hexulose isomerase [Variovorax sp. RO1]